MKILVLATDIFSRGGIARYTSTLCSTLGQMLGPENVDALCFFDWGYAGNLPSDFRVTGMVSAGTRASLRSRLRFLSECGRAGFKGYDLVIANHVALAPVAVAMKLAFGTPYWVSCHCIEVWWGTSSWRRAALRNADFILPVSGYTADLVRKIDGIRSSKVTVVYNAIPNSFAELLMPQRGASNGVKKNLCGRFLLSVCSLAGKNEFKGVDTVIRVLPKILKVIPDLRYVVVGDGELRKNLEGLAADTGVADRVSFVGEVSDVELARLYRGCDVFVLPSRGQHEAGTVGGEGFGRVYVEAALAGKPVVGSRVGGASEAVLHGRTGLLVNPNSGDEVAEGLLTILTDADLAACMGAEGRAWSLRTFSEDALANSLTVLLPPYGFKGGISRELARAG
jgi:glycosyltransferase involved in cell wall biosynthesis